MNGVYRLFGQGVKPHKVLLHIRLYCVVLMMPTKPYSPEQLPGLPNHVGSRSPFCIPQTTVHSDMRNLSHSITLDFNGCPTLSVTVINAGSGYRRHCGTCCLTQKLSCSVHSATEPWSMVVTILAQHTHCGILLLNHEEMLHLRVTSVCFKIHTC